jgi:isocitrate dehydrogenase kinase/phosphatase
VVLVEHPVLCLVVQLCIPQLAEMVLMLTVTHLAELVVPVQHQTEQQEVKLDTQLLLVDTAMLLMEQQELMVLVVVQTPLVVVLQELMEREMVVSLGVEVTLRLETEAERV